MTEYNVPPPQSPPAQMWFELAENALRRAYKASSTGEIFYHTGTPDYAILCDGRAVARLTYECLFAVIGETYGAGDGLTTFNLPIVADLPASNGTDARAWIRT